MHFAKFTPQKASADFTVDSGSTHFRSRSSQYAANTTLSQYSWKISFLYSQVFSGIFYISTYEGVRHLMATRFDIHDLVLRAAVGGLCASVVGQMITVPFDIVSQHMMLLGGDQTKETKRIRIARLVQKHS